VNTGTGWTNSYDGEYHTAAEIFCKTIIGKIQNGREETGELRYTLHYAVKFSYNVMKGAELEALF